MRNAHNKPRLTELSGVAPRAAGAAPPSTAINEVAAQYQPRREQAESGSERRRACCDAAVERGKGSRSAGGCAGTDEFHEIATGVVHGSSLEFC